MGSGGYMVFSAITGKGISAPDIKSDYLYIQYRMRGIIGVVFIFVGVLLFIEIFKAF